MFTVTFLVSFGPKKGAISAYSSYWYNNIRLTFQTLTSFFNKPNLITFLN